MISFTFFATLQSLQEVGNQLKTQLGTVVTHINTSQKGYQFLLDDNTPLAMEISPLADTGEKLLAQKQQLIDFYGAVQTKHPTTQEGLKKQIALWNVMLTIAFPESEDADRNNFIFSSVVKTAHALHGYLLLEDMTLLNGKGQIVFNKEGHSDEGSFVPARPRPVQTAPAHEPSANDVARFERSKKALGNLTYKERDTWLFLEKHLKLKEVALVGQRIISLFTVGSYAQTMVSNGGLYNEGLLHFAPYNEKYEVQKFMTLDELQFLNQWEFSPEQGTRFLNAYEHCTMLCWAVGIIPEMPDPTSPWPLSDLTHKITAFKDTDTLVNACKLRSTDALLGAQDILLRYHWACCDQKAPSNVNPNVISARLKAINWVISDFYGITWDTTRSPS